MKQLRTAQTSPDHLLTLSTEKRNTKLSESSHTDNLDDQNGCNISLNGKDTPKATTHGNQLIKFMPLNLSSIINPLPTDFPLKDLTPLKRSKYDFDPSEPRSHSIFRFRYKLGTDHVSIRHWYCKLSYCPFHHRY